MKTIDSQAILSYMTDLQEHICSEIHKSDQVGSFREDTWERAAGGGGRTRVYEGGKVFEKAGVNFSHVHGEALPPAATKTRPELAGRRFEATGVSVVCHPHNPYCPTAHLNVRCFCAYKENEDPVWWFGGGFDLTPYYGFEEDAIHFHRVAKDCAREDYEEFKEWADRYFFLPHRDEPRGVGGIFFDDYNRVDFEHSFAFTQRVGNGFTEAYIPIINRRKDTPYGEREKDFQKYRRGRYVEFNLVYDRGTLFGLQSGGRTESILMSLPAEVSWKYDWSPEPGTEEARLYEEFLKPRDWLTANCTA